MFVTVPVVPELVLILAPFWEFLMTEFVKRTLDTSLLDFPPIEPMESPCPPSQTMLETVILVPEVTATQSSWLMTVVLVMTILLLEDRSKPSELCAAGRPPEAELAAFPAELSSVKPLIVVPDEEVISKQCTGQFWIWRFSTTEVPVVLRTMKWSGLVTPPLEPCPSHHAWPLPSMTAPDWAVTVISWPPISIRSESQSVKANVVFPANVTVVPVFNLLRFRVLEAGTAKLEMRMLVHAAVADAT